MPLLKVVLNPDEQEALNILAKRELRDPRSQAKLLLRRELQRLKLLAIYNHQEGQDDNIRTYGQNELPAGASGGRSEQ